MEFVPVRVSTLRGDQQIPFDLFIQIAEKHILYIRRGYSFEGDRLSKIKEKKVKRMYIQAQDEENYRNYISLNLDAAYNGTGNKSIENRAAIVQGAQQASAEEVFEDPTSELSYTNAKLGASKYVEFILKQDAALKSMMAIENTDQSIAHHGVTVSTLAIAIAEKLGMANSQFINLLALGALLHDFEHYHSGLSIARPLKDFTPEQMQTYRNHPIDGAKRVNTLKHFDQTVIHIILQHEELVNGSGFPKGLRENEIDPFAMVVGTANMFDRLVTFEKMPKKDALKEMMIGKLGLYPLANIKALQEVLREKGVL